MREAIVAPISQIRPATYLGKGKVEEIVGLVSTHAVELVVMDCALSPVQQRNLEKAWNTKVLDRTGLILEIFGRRAKTREGTLQVELAQYEYRLPRLTRMWTHLGRLTGGAAGRGGNGGVGLRGPGERQPACGAQESARKFTKFTPRPPRFVIFDGQSLASTGRLPHGPRLSADGA